jgi:pyruvate/oxaloacetate carboxyltransferase
MSFRRILLQFYSHCPSLIGAIRKAHPDLPIHVHSHDTAGIAAASMIACAAAGADVVDVAIDSKFYSLIIFYASEFPQACRV